MCCHGAMHRQVERKVAAGVVLILAAILVVFVGAVGTAAFLLARAVAQYFVQCG